MFMFLCSACIRILPPISASLQMCRLQFSGHCCKKKMRLFPNYFFGNQNMADTQRGHPATTNNIILLTNLESDTSLLRQDRASVMANRREWERFIKSVRVHLKQIDRQMQLPFCLQFMFQLSSLAHSSETWAMMCILTASYYILTIRS